MLRDLRVCFVGDSFTAGVGDPEHLGWVGRIAVRSARAGLPITAYPLGVRRQTTAQVARRLLDECSPRLRDGGDPRLVVCTGVNDTTIEDGDPRLAPADSGKAFAAVLQVAEWRSWPLLVVGPPPIADAGQNERIAALDARFAAACAERGVPYVPVAAELVGKGTWMREAAAGDGAHPGAAGYAALADLVWPHWQSWLTDER